MARLLVHRWQFGDLYPALGQPVYVPWRLALITPMQFHDGLYNLQSADAVWVQIDWMYLRTLDLADPGFDPSVLRKLHARSLEREARGLAKTTLQSLVTVAAINLDRLAAWLAERLLAPACTPRFAALGT